MFVKRLVTASILVPVVAFFIIHCEGLWFLLLTSVLLSVGLFEWAKLIGLSSQKKFLYFCFVWFLGFLSLFIPTNIVLYSGMFFWIVVSFFVANYPKIKQNIFINFGGIISGFFVFIPAWAGLNILRQFGSSYVFALLFLIWAMDTGGYVFGKFFGKNLLAKNVSAGKTIEGLVGGFVIVLWLYTFYFMKINNLLLYSSIIIKTILISFTPFFISLLLNRSKSKLIQFVFIIIIAIICCLFFPIAFKNWLIWLYWFFVVLVTSMIAVLGDLFESMMKRIAKVKDSGNILPGHGGVLDRIDSLLAASTFFAFFVLSLQNSCFFKLI